MNVITRLYMQQIIREHSSVEMSPQLEAYERVYSMSKTGLKVC